MVAALTFPPSFLSFFPHPFAFLEVLEAFLGNRKKKNFFFICRRGFVDGWVGPIEGLDSPFFLHNSLLLPVRYGSSADTSMRELGY